MTTAAADRGSHLSRLRIIATFLRPVFLVAALLVATAMGLRAEAAPPVPGFRAALRSGLN